MKTKLIVAALLTGALAGPVAVKLTHGKTAKPVEMHTVAQKELRPTILASGVLAFQQEVMLSTELIGPVAEIYVREGQRVRKGQPLMRLEQGMYAADLEQQQASRRSALLAVERARLQLVIHNTTLQRTASLVDR